MLTLLDLSGHCPNLTALKALVHLRLQGCEHGASMTYAAMSSSTLRLMFVGLMANPAPLKDTDMESCEVPEVKWERLQDHGCLARHKVCIDQACCFTANSIHKHGVLLSI